LRWSYGVRLLAQADPETSLQVAGAEPTESSPLLERDETAFPPPPAEDDLRRRQQQHKDADTTRTPSGSSTPRYTRQQEDDLRRAAEEAGLQRSWDPPRHDIPAILVRAPTADRMLRPGVERKGTGVFYSFPNSPSQMARDMPEEESPTPYALDAALDAGASDEEDADEFPAPGVGRREITAPTTSRLHSLRRRAWRRVRNFWTAFNDFMTVPLWAALLSLIVALVQPLQHGLDDHFPPVKNALTAAGNCSIPVTLIVLGAYFYTPPSDEKAEGGQDRDGSLTSVNKRESMASLASVVGSVRGMLRMGSLRGKERAAGQSLMASAGKEEKVPGESKTVFVAVLSRMVVTPLLLLPGMALSAKFDWHQVLEE
jgi:auxin efflux carrier family protein